MVRRLNPVHHVIEYREDSIVLEAVGASVGSAGARARPAVAVRVMSVGWR